MTIIEKKANALANILVAKGVAHSTAFDPMTILAIIQVISELFKLLQLCNKTPPVALQIVRNPNLVERWWIRRIAIERLGRKKYNEIGDKVEEGIKIVGNDTSVEEVVEIYKEIQ